MAGKFFKWQRLPPSANLVADVNFYHQIILRVYTNVADLKGFYITQ